LTIEFFEDIKFIYHKTNTNIGIQSNNLYFLSFEQLNHLFLFKISKFFLNYDIIYEGIYNYRNDFLLTRYLKFLYFSCVFLLLLIFYIYWMIRKAGVGLVSTIFLIKLLDTKQ
jgi:hypothetical protein